jgi:enoyl-[acyl-carrier protein] reductase II
MNRAYQSRITKLFGIEYPLIQAGMVWCSGWRLASAVSNAGGLGIIGSGSMYPDVLRTHIRKAKLATSKAFGVNLPLLYPDIDKQIDVITEEGVKIVFTSAGNPKTWTGYLKEKGIKVVHVVSSAKFAKKSVEAGVDAVVAEGFEAGGHNGREETTTLCLIPLVREAVDVPLIAAGGISGGRAMLASMVLGAEAVQIGSRFVASEESSAHDAFKQEVIKAAEGQTTLVMKKLNPVRLLHNPFYELVKKAEDDCAAAESLKELLGKGRAKMGMFEGKLDVGELEIGQVSALIKEKKPAAEIVREIITEFDRAVEAVSSRQFSPPDAKPSP